MKQQDNTCRMLLPLLFISMFFLQACFCSYPTDIDIERPTDMFFPFETNEAKTQLLGIADYDCDGHKDYIVGVPDENAIYVIWNKTSLTNLTLNEKISDNKNGIKISGPPKFGSSIAVVADMTGDNCQELVIGSPWEDADSNNVGAIYVVYSQAVGEASGKGRLLQSSDYFNFIVNEEMDSTVGFRLEGTVEDGFFGSSVASLDADCNGDGINDIIVGASGEEKAYIISSAITTSGPISNQPFFKVDDDANYYGALGLLVAAAGDVNKDGLADFLVSTAENAVYLVLGSKSFTSGSSLTYSVATASNSRAIRFIGDESTLDPLGWSIGPLGDINGDSFDDFFVSGNKASYVLYGNTTFSTNKMLLSKYSTLPASQGKMYTSGLSFGASWARGGDYNADGVNDYLVGSPLNNQISSINAKGESTLAYSYPSFESDVSVTGMLFGQQTIATSSQIIVGSPYKIRIYQTCASNQYYTWTTLISCTNCSTLNEHCLTCSDSNTCVTCEDGYKAEGSGCKKKLSGGQITGIVLGSVFGFAAIVGVIVLIVKKTAANAATKAYLSKLKKAPTGHQALPGSPSAILQTEGNRINIPAENA